MCSSCILFDCLASVRVCPFSLHPGVGDWMHFVITALSGLF